MKYFAYGSNMSFGQMRERCPEAKFLCGAYIKNYKFVYDGDSVRFPGFSVANIVFSKGHAVWGGLFEICEKDLKDLDEYETFPRLYQRKEVEVCLDGFQCCKALVYYRTPQEEGEPNPKYIELVLEGARDCNLPEDYIKMLKFVKKTIKIL